MRISNARLRELIREEIGHPSKSSGDQDPKIISEEALRALVQEEVSYNYILKTINEADDSDEKKKKGSSKLLSRAPAGITPESLEVVKNYTTVKIGTMTVGNQRNRPTKAYKAKVGNIHYISFKNTHNVFQVFQVTPGREKELLSRIRSVASPDGIKELIEKMSISASRFNRISPVRAGSVDLDGKSRSASLYKSKKGDKYFIILDNSEVYEVKPGQHDKVIAAIEPPVQPF